MSDQHDRPDEHAPDRMGLEAFDAVDTPDQWDDITRRADGAELGSSSPTNSRRSAATWFMAAAAVALVAVAAVAVSVRSGADTAPTPATTPDDTIAPPDTSVTTPATPTESTIASDLVELSDWTGMPAGVAIEDLQALGLRFQLVEVVDETAGHYVVLGWSVLGDVDAAPGSLVPTGSVVELTVAVSPETAAPPPDTVPDMVDGAVVTAWNPDCVEQTGSGEPPSTVDEALTRFTTLAADPSLDIAIPTVDTTNGIEPPLARAVVVPGGVALVFDGFLGSQGYVTAVTVIDDDGGVRWRRCLQTTGVSGLLVPDGDSETLAIVSVLIDGDSVGSVIQTIDLASGVDIGSPASYDDSFVAYVDDDRVLLATTWVRLVEPDDELLVVDIEDGSITPVPYPEIAVGGLSDSVRFEIVAGDGATRLAGIELGEALPSVVWTGDSWSNDPDDLRALPPTVRIPFGNDEPLQLIDGAGDVVWEVDGFHSISREGFNNAITDSVVLAMECLDWIDDLGCQWVDENTPPREQLAAFDLATGERLWTRPGGQAFAAIDGDRGIVTADQGWELIDLRTGERVVDQPVAAWPQDDIWANECCGAGDYIWTRLDGGVLFESTGDRLRVWLPPEASTPTITTDAFS